MNEERNVKYAGASAMTPDMPPDSDIRHRFSYHKPGEAIEVKHERIRRSLLMVAEEMDGLLPSGREANVVQTKLEEAMFWANAAIARNQR